MAIRLADTTTAMGDFPVVEAKEVSVEIGGDTKYLQDAIDNGEIGGGSSTFVGTQAEWEALLPTEKEKYEFVDFTDDFGGAMIDDTTSATDKVYSSSKVENLIGSLFKIITFKLALTDLTFIKSNGGIFYSLIEPSDHIPTYSKIISVGIANFANLSAENNINVAYREPDKLFLISNTNSFLNGADIYLRVVYI